MGIFTRLNNIIRGILFFLSVIVLSILGIINITPSKPKKAIYYDTVKVETQTVKIVYDTIKVKQYIKIPIDTNTQK